MTAHVKSMVIFPGHKLADPFAGTHHVYANNAAIEGLKTGVYRDGSVLVFDLLQTQEGEAQITEGARKFIGVMVRDRKAYSATGGWGFEAFAGGSKSRRMVEDGGKSCFACHQSQAGKSYVFSQYRP